MDEFKYIPLDPFTRLNDKLRTKIRDKNIIINGETWNYQYHWGELSYISSLIKKNNICYCKTIRFGEKTKKPLKCKENSWYSKDGHPGGVNHGEVHEYLIDSYGNNIGELKYEHWTHGTKDGKFTSWDNIGNLIKDEEFKDDKPIGLHRKYCERCLQLLFEGSFSDFGIPINDHKTYECYGDPDSKTKFLQSIIKYYNGFDDYEEIIYYENNLEQIQKQCRYFGKESGVCKHFDTNGRLIKEETLKNGVQNGHYTRFSNSGEVIEEGEVKNGKKIGKWTVNEDYNEN